MTEQKNHSEGSSIRWQTITIQQLSYVVNLILALSVSTLGFSTSLLMDVKFIPTGWLKLLFISSLVACFFFYCDGDYLFNK